MWLIGSQKPDRPLFLDDEPGCVRDEPVVSVIATLLMR